MRPICCHPGPSWFPIKDTLHLGFLCNINVSSTDKAHFDHTGFILLFSILTLCLPPLTEEEASQHQSSVGRNNGLKVFPFSNSAAARHTNGLTSGLKVFSYSAAAWHLHSLLLLHLSSHCSVTQATACLIFILNLNI